MNINDLIKEIDNLKEELKDKNLYINQLELNNLEIENLKDIEINILKNKINDYEIKNHKLIKEIDYLNDYINDMEKYN